MRFNRFAFGTHHSMHSSQGSTRDLARTSPTEKEYDFRPVINASPSPPPPKEAPKQSLEDRLKKGTASSKLGSKIAKKKKEMIEENGGRGTRDRMSASGLLGGVDEVEAFVLSEEKLARMKREDAQNGVGKATARGGGKAGSNKLSPQRERLKELKGGSRRQEEREGITKETLSSFLRRNNQEKMKQEIEVGRRRKDKGGYLSDRFRSPGSLFYEIEHSANIDVAHWQYAGDEDDGTFRKSITEASEVEENQRRIDDLYEKGVTHWQKRDVLRRNAPLDSECSFSPKFFTKRSRGDKMAAYGKGISKESGGKQTFLRKESPKKDNKEVVLLSDDQKAKLARLEKSELIECVASMTRRSSDLVTMEHYLSAKCQKGDAAANVVADPKRLVGGRQLFSTPLHTPRESPSALSEDDYEMTKEEEEELRRLEEEEEKEREKEFGEGGGGR